MPTKNNGTVRLCQTSKRPVHVASRRPCDHLAFFTGSGINLWKALALSIDPVVMTGSQLFMSGVLLTAAGMFFVGRIEWL